MIAKRKRLQRKQLGTVLALGKVQTEQAKGRDRTMLQEKTKYWREVNSE